MNLLDDLEALDAYLPTPPYPVFGGLVKRTDDEVLRMLKDGSLVAISRQRVREIIVALRAATIDAELEKP